jgi:SAM-dependent methyltransferase
MDGREIWKLARVSVTTIFHEGWSSFFRRAVDMVRWRKFTKRIHLSRENIAQMYLKGAGIEIGGLNSPLKVPARANVKYVDRLPLPMLREQFPELAGRKLVDVQIVDDGETLTSIAGSSLDFVIANHFIEHCENPLGAIKNMLRVLKNQGIIYISIPDKRFTFDVDREITSTEHIIRDYEHGPAHSKKGHFEEWARVVDKVPEESVEENVRSLLKSNASIHYHVWTQTEILEMLLTLKKAFSLNFEVELIYKNGSEVILVLRKEH